MAEVELVNPAMEQVSEKSYSVLYRRGSRKWKSFFTTETSLDPPSPTRTASHGRNGRTLSTDTLHSTHSSSNRTNRSVKRASHLFSLPNPKYQRLNNLSSELKNLYDELHCLSNAIDQSLNFFLGIEEEWETGASMASAFVHTPPTHIPGAVLLLRDKWDEETVLESKVAYVKEEVGVPRRVLRDIVGAVLGRGVEIKPEGKYDSMFSGDDERGRSTRNGSSGTSRIRQRSRSISPWPGPGMDAERASKDPYSYVSSISSTAPQIPPLDIEIQTKDRDVPRYLIRYQASGAHTFQGKTADFYCSRWRESVANFQRQRETHPRSISSDFLYHLLNAKDSSPYISASSSPVEILEFMMASGVHIEHSHRNSFKNRKSASSMCLPVFNKGSFNKETSIFRRSSTATNTDRNGTKSPGIWRKGQENDKPNEVEVPGTVSIIDTDVLERLGIKYLRTAEMRNKMKIPYDKVYATWSHWLVVGWIPGEAVKRTFSITEYVDICTSYDVLADLGRGVRNTQHRELPFDDILKAAKATGVSNGNGSLSDDLSIGASSEAKEMSGSVWFI